MAFALALDLTTLWEVGYGKELSENDPPSHKPPASHGHDPPFAVAIVHI